MWNKVQVIYAGSTKIPTVLIKPNIEKVRHDI